MKLSNHLLLPAIFVALFGCNSQSHKKTNKYTDFDHGYYLYFYKKYDSAFIMFTRYIDNPDDTINKAKAYNYMGEMQWKINDLSGAEESLTGTIQTLDSNNLKHREDLGNAYQLLGNVRLDSKQYDDAIYFYNLGIALRKGSDYVTEIMNGKATAFQKKGSYEDAIIIYDSILSLKPADQEVVAQVIDNKARTKWLQNPAYPVLQEFQSALKIRSDNQYNRGLNASYAHLSDYYRISNRDSALWFAKKMYGKAKEIESPDDILEALDKLIILSTSPELKDEWYNEYKKIDDSLLFKRSTTKNQFALIKYDSQKSKTISLELKEQVIMQWLWLCGLFLLAIVIITWLWRRYNKRRNRIKLEAEQAIQQSKLKTSQKVHDVVANGLYVIMNELEHGKMIEKNELITRIEQLYEKSRDISYQDSSAEDSTKYDREIHQLLDDFTTEKTNVYAAGNQPAFWDKVTPVQKKQILLVLKELLVNMKKHSGAKNVSVVFRQEYGRGFITYKDDGTGFPPDIEFGNGLRNTVNRIKLLNGEVIFGKSDKAGASVAINFPLEPNEL